MAKKINVKINSVIYLSSVIVFAVGGICITNISTNLIAYMNAMINGLTILV